MSNLRLINMQDVEVEEVQWLIYPFIPYGKVTIIQGDPGEGKTTLVLQIIARLTKGESILNEEAKPPINVIYQTAEDGLADTIKPRLLSADADCSRVLVIDDRDTPLTMLDVRLEKAIAETNAKLVVLDPLQGFLGADVDMHRANEIRPVMKHIAELAEKYKCAIILIGHMNKCSTSKSTYRGLGTIDLL
jgi:RecA-family ATPase